MEFALNWAHAVTCNLCLQHDYLTSLLLSGVFRRGASGDAPMPPLAEIAIIYLF